MSAADLELSLRRWSGDDYALDIRFQLSSSAAPAQLVVGPPPRIHLNFEDLLTQQLDPDAYGAALGRALFADPRVGEALAKAQAQAESLGIPLRLRLRLAADDDSLHALRWETLHAPDGSGPLARSERILLSRHFDSADMTPLSIGPRDGLRALIVVAGPDPSELARYNLAPVDVSAEQRRARAALGDLPCSVVASGVGQGAALDAIVAALRDGPAIIYLVAHGTLRRGRPYLWLDGGASGVERIDGVELVEAIARLPRRPLLVVLASCHSAGDGSGEALAALGPQLAAAGVAAVLAMQGSLAIASAGRLLPAFFQELWRDGLVDRALAAARLALRGSGDWWQPALFLRVPDGRLWLDAPIAPTPAPAGPAIPAPPLPERPPDLAGFVGRAAELDAFADTLAAAGMVMLTGMPGVGKTSMASALARRAGDPATTFWHSFRADEGVDALVWALAGFLARQGRGGLWDLLQGARLAGGQPPPARVLLDYLVQLLDGSGLLLCLDDFHLVDDDPQLPPFVERLRPLLRGGQLRLILTCWHVPGFALAEHVELLTGLSPSDAELLLAGRGVVLERALMAELYAQIGGNAQLLTLAADALRRTDDPARLVGALIEADNIERYLLDAIDAALSAEERATMKPIAALLGPGGTRGAIEAVADGASVRRPLRSLSDRHLLLTQEAAAGREYRQHALVQRFYYEELSKRERSELHRRAAAYYERDEPDPLRAATHYGRAGEHGRAAAIARAAREALVNAGQATALLALLGQLDPAGLDTPDAGALLLARGELAAMLRRRDLAEPALQALLAHPASAAETPAARSMRARACASMAELFEADLPREALGWLERGLAALGDVDPAVRGRLLNRAGSIRIALGDLAGAGAALDAALPSLEAADDPAAALALLNMGVLRCSHGEIADGAALFERALAICRRHGRSWDELVVRQNLSMAREIGGDWPGAEAEYRAVLALAEQLGNPLRQCELAHALGALRANRGDLAEAAALLGRGEQVARRHSLRENLIYILTSQAGLALRRDDLAGAEGRLDEADALSTELDLDAQRPEIYCHRSALCLRRGDSAGALALARQAVDAARVGEDPLAEGASLRALGAALLAAGRGAAAREALAASAELLADEPFELARTQAAWAAALAASGEAARGAALSDEARATFERLGAAAQPIG